MSEFGQLEEINRLKELLSYNILDTPYEEDFNGLVELISIICESPIAIISMIDDKRQWYKAKIGIDRTEVSRQESFCRHTLLQDCLVEIPDARLDERVNHSPHVTAQDGIRFYAGIPLKTSNGFNIGTVCVVDTIPKHLTSSQKKALQLLTDQAMMLLEARKKNHSLGNEVEGYLKMQIRETKIQLIQKENDYNRLLKAIKRSSGVIEFSPDGEIQEINKYFLESFGYTKNEVIGKHHRILLDEESKTQNIQFWNDLSGGKFKSGRLKRLHKDGSDLWIQASYNPILDSENNIIKIIKIGQDITREVVEEKAVNIAKTSAEALNIQKDNFIANISHELRTPIHAILGFTELLLEGEKDSNKKNYLRSVKTAGDNLLFIINDILDLSKIEAGVIHMDLDAFDLKQVVENVFSILHLKAHQKKINFHFYLPGDITHQFLGDKYRLTQILINILGNAIKFTSSGSVELFVSLSKKASNKADLEFKTVDTGIGIPPGKLEMIFERFSQAEDNTTRQFGGTGLGLNISKQLIEKQNGFIKVKSELGKGSTFVFIIPYLIGEPLIAEESKEVKIIREIQSARILMCEDNELNQRLTHAILTEAGCKVDLAENGMKGIELLKNNTYDLVLMDIQMPVMDGYQATSIIRNELLLSIPILALTANFMLIEKQKCLDLGMTDYLAKPFNKEELFAKIENWSGNNKGEPNNRQTAEETGIIDLGILNEISGGDRLLKKR